MVFDSRMTLKKVEGFLAASGYFTSVGIGERKTPPSGDSLSADIWLKSMRVIRLYCNGGTAESHVILIRIYRDLFALPIGDTEYILAKTVQQVLSDILSAIHSFSYIFPIDWGANIDSGGRMGQALRTDWGHVNIGGKMFRVADITLPLCVDDSATMAP